MTTLRPRPAAVGEAARPDHADYDRDGVIQVNGLFTAEEMDTVRAAFTEQVREDRTALGARDQLAPGDILSRYPRFMQPHRRTDLEVGRLARRLMLDGRLLDVVRRLIGPADGAQSMFYFKPPTARGQAMHQDNYFLRAHPETCLAAWIAVDGCDAANGALSVVPGSHTMEVVCPEEADAAESFTRGLVRPPDGMRAVQTSMDPGDVLFFHGSLVHGSLPNTTTDRFRRSLIFHYVPRSSREIARWYLPLVAPDGSDRTIAAASGGGPCGET
ncbi:phytanoyl-CoA dioxygenase family protein [Streptomyces sp. NPDC050658]|uniref:phytanoyl-CoA dioxygenase family protein n=1 Tax=unclassified Streptomyces TaxID=2593676 RepID=UPI00342F4AAB